MSAVVRYAGIAAVLLLAACEGLFTGDKASKQPLTQAEDGGFATVKLALDPDMNPIALNLHGETVANPQESERWNSYRATLSLAGVPIASGNFDINNTGSQQNAPQGGPFRHTMLIVNVPQRAEYELAIMLAKPKEITIEAPQLEVRRNVQPVPR